MKRSISLALALLMIIFSSLVCFADDSIPDSDEGGEADEFVGTMTFECEQTDIAKGYNYGSVVEVTYELEITNLPEDTQGISVIYLQLCYDHYVLTPAIIGEEDEDGDKNDYSDYATGGPDEWMAFGTIFAEDSALEICYWDDMSDTRVQEGDVITFTVPFKVNDPKDCETENVEFNHALVSVSFCELYENDLKTVYQAPTDTITLYRAIQPEEAQPLPETAIPLHIAGYRHAANNVIWYSDEGSTIGSYIESYMEITNNQQDMNYFAIAIVDAETGKVVLMDTAIGRPQSDKSAVYIPSDHYIIGVNGNNIDDYNAFCDQIRTGATIKLYNVNVDATKNAIPEMELVGAGFEILSSEPIFKEDANAIYDEESLEVKVFENDISISEFKEMIENEIVVTDEEGNEIPEDYLLKTGMKIDAKEPIDIIVMGDVNGDGLVNQYDYILIRRHYLETFTLEGAFLKAACISNGESVVIYDYIYVKRAYFGTLDLAVLCEKV